MAGQQEINPRNPKAEYGTDAFLPLGTETGYVLGILQKGLPEKIKDARFPWRIKLMVMVMAMAFFARVGNNKFLFRHVEVLDPNTI